MKRNIHHLGYACNDIYSTISNLKKFYDVKSVSDVIFDELQNAYVCFLQINNSSNIELVSGEAVKAFLHSDLNLYHVCYEVDNLEEAVKEYKMLGGIPLSKPKPAKLFNNRRVVFLNTKIGLVELLEKQQDQLTILEKFKNQHQDDATNTNEPEILIASTFALSIYEQAIKHIIKTIGSHFKVTSLSYNQLFQQFLIENSLRTNQNGCNIILLRLEDFAYEENTQDKSSDYFKKIKTHALELIEILKKSQEHVPCFYLFFICPHSEKFINDVNFKEINELEQEFFQLLGNITNVQAFKANDITSIYSIKNTTDEYTNRIANIPYTSEFEAALALISIRKIYSSTPTTPYKVIVVDCDQTLWDGVCAEIGAKGITITPSRQEFQKFLLKKVSEGFLLAVVSKNKKSDVLLAFDNAPNMLLKKKHISYWAVNWKSKSENLRMLSRKFNLLLDSFIFIDDNSIERADVKVNCPAVFVPEIPDDPAKITTYLQEALLFNQENIKSGTDVSNKRTLLYREAFEREKEIKKYTTLKEFIASLNLKIEIDHIKYSQAERVLELMNRTTQFNTSGLKFQLEKLQEITYLKHGCLTVKAADRFGSYGLIGAAFYAFNKKELVVSGILISCRALGKGIEHSLIRKIGEIASILKIKNILIHYVPTGRNTPALNFLDSLNCRKKIKNNSRYIYYIESKMACLTSFDPDKNKALNTYDKSKINSVRNQQICVDRNDLNIILHQFRSPQILLSEVSKKDGKPSTAFIRKDPSIESKLKCIWESILEIPEIHLHDNFYDLGGESLQAVQILSRICSDLSIELTLIEFYKNQTIEKLAKYIKKTNKSHFSDNEKLVLASYNQKSLWKIDKIFGESWFYNMPLAIELKGKIDIKALKKSFQAIVNRHEVLRTNFIEKEGVLYQTIKKTISLPFKILLSLESQKN